MSRFVGRWMNSSKRNLSLKTIWSFLNMSNFLQWIIRVAYKNNTSMHYCYVYANIYLEKETKGGLAHYLTAGLLLVVCHAPSSLSSKSAKINKDRTSKSHFFWDTWNECKSAPMQATKSCKLFSLARCKSQATPWHYEIYSHFFFIFKRLINR